MVPFRNALEQGCHPDFDISGVIDADDIYYSVTVNGGDMGGHPVP